MRYSGIGGQAVMEGVMMKNQEKYAVAVRKPDHEIEVKVSEYTGIIRNKKIRNMPILRGVFSFIESLVLGMQTLTYSASFFEDEEEEKRANDGRRAQETGAEREETGKCHDGRNRCIIDCSCCGSIYDASILFIDSVSESNYIPVGDRIVRGSDPSGDFHRICSTYLSDEGYPACLYVPWCRT